MNGLSKIIGGVLGFLLAGPVGCLLGVFIGHIFDKNLSQGKWYDQPYQQYGNTATQQIFFESTFLVMGYIAKLDGRISEVTIQNARAVMQEMGLNETRRLKAMQLFNEGKQGLLALEPVLNRLVAASRHNRHLLEQFLAIQTKMAVTEANKVTEAKKKTLEKIYRVLGFSMLKFDWLDSFMENVYQTREQHEYIHRRYQPSVYANSGNLVQAYHVLGISQEATQAEIKQAYRRLRSQYHPDKLTSQGVSNIEIQQANEKTQRIQEAYAKICEAKGFS